MIKVKQGLFFIGFLNPVCNNGVFFQISSRVGIRDTLSLSLHPDFFSKLINWKK